VKNAKEFLNLLKEQKSGDKKTKAKRSKLVFYAAVFIKKNATETKFKIRGGRYFYTFRADKSSIVDAILKGLGKDVERVEIKKRRVVAKKAKK
jgi:hypothetical protein